jgi:flagellar motor switch/type III secretory pathway protein FliN
MGTTPYILLRESDRREIREIVEQRVCVWSSAWLPPATTMVIERLIVINNASDLSKAITTLREYRIADAGFSRVAYLKAPSSRRFVNLLLASSGNDAAVGSTDVEKGLEEASLDKLAEHILDSTEIRAQDVQASDADKGLLSALRPGAAAVCCEIAVDDVPLSILLSPEAVRHIWSRVATTSKGETTTDVRDALLGLESASVKIRAQLPAAEMSIGDLASMNVGDVIRLDACVDENITLRVGEYARSLNANLGLSSGSRAVQIAGFESE